MQALCEPSPEQARARAPAPAPAAFADSPRVNGLGTLVTTVAVTGCGGRGSLTAAPDDESDIQRTLATSVATSASQAARFLAQTKLCGSAQVQTTSHGSRA
jgi:hypothetical protein